MKYFILFLLIIFPFSTYAVEKEDALMANVSVVNCTSPSDVWVKYNNITERIKLIAYNNSENNFDNEINNYFCKLLNDSQNITIEYDPLCLEKDKYNRQAVWLYVDGRLMQKELIEKGYGQVGNIYNNYKYLSDLCLYQKDAIINKLGIWKNSNVSEEYCNSGININKTSKKEQVKETSKKSLNKKSLYKLLLINSFILILILLYKNRYYKKTN